MKSIVVKACIALLAVLLTAGVWVAFWWQSATRPDDAVREICIGSAAYPDWYLAEKQVAGAVYYTIYSRRGNTPWDRRFGDRPGGWLYGQSVSASQLLLQRTDGSTWRLDRCTGEYREVPPPQEPLIPLGGFFGNAQTVDSESVGNP